MDVQIERPVFEVLKESTEMISNKQMEKMDGKKEISIRFLKRISLVLIGYVLCYFNLSITLAVVSICTIIWFEMKTFQQRKRLSSKYNSTVIKKGEILKIFEELPSWVTFPDKERAEWLNEIILQLWPSLNNSIIKYCKGPLQTKIRKKFNSFRFENVDFGASPPKIDGVKVYKQKVSKDSVIIDFEVFYDGDCDINFSVSGTQIGGIKDFQMGVDVRLVLKPILLKFPLVGGIQIFFLNSPDINFELDGITGIPGLDYFVRQKIQELISKKIVFPNKITKRFTKSVEAAELKSLEPEGVLRVHVFEARDLEKKDVTGKSDPYVILKVGSQEYKTSVIKRNLNPQWDYWCEFIVVDPVGQRLYYQLFDEDEFNEDDFLGSGVIDIHTVIKEKENDKWFKLDNAKHGKIHFRFTWLGLSTDLDSLDAACEEIRLLKVANVSSAILIVYIDSVHGLPQLQSYIKPDPFLVLTVGKNQVKTRVKKHTLDPIFEQGFCLLVHKPETDSLIITVKDKHTDDIIDEMVYRIGELFDQPEMQISKEEFSLNKDASKITISLQLRILSNALYDPYDSDEDSDYEFRRKDSKRSSVRSTSFGRATSDNSSHSKITGEEVLTKALSTQNTSMPMTLSEQQSFRIKPDVYGQIELTLGYSELRQKLMATVHKITNLPLKEATSLPDAYVKLKLVSCETSSTAKYKTKVVEECSNPVYEETFEFLLSASELANCKLVLSVKSKKTFGAHFIGQCIIHLKNSRVFDEPVREWYDILEVQESE